MKKHDNFFEMVKDWTVNDYRTQKAKAEIIVDMMISEFVEEVVEYKLNQNEKERKNKPKLIAKEFPISREGQLKLTGPIIERIKQGEITSKELGTRQYANVDYLLKDDNTIYLVELKTTDESVAGEQLLNMVCTCKAGGESLYYRFYDLVVNYALKEKPNDLKTKKYLYTLKFMNDLLNDKEDISCFGEVRDQNTELWKKQVNAAKNVMEKTFGNFKGCKIKIIYLVLDSSTQGKIIKEKNDMGLASDCIDQIVVLEDLIKCKEFTNSFKDDDRCNLWKDTEAILKLLLQKERLWFMDDKS